MPNCALPFNEAITSRILKFRRLENHRLTDRGDRVGRDGLGRGGVHLGPSKHFALGGGSFRGRAMNLARVSLSIFAEIPKRVGKFRTRIVRVPRPLQFQEVPTFVSHQCDFAPADRSQRCIRPPSYITQTACGGLTPAGAANFWTSGNCSHHRVWRSRSQTRSAPIRSASRSTRFVVNWTSAISARLSCVDWKEGSFVAR